MAQFAFSPVRAERIKDELDQNLTKAEHFLEQIERAIPQAGATVSRLEDARRCARGVVSDLYEEIDRRTEVSDAQNLPNRPTTTEKGGRS